jgi:hypothetical protein
MDMFRQLDHHRYASSPGRTQRVDTWSRTNYTLPLRQRLRVNVP